MCTTAMRNYKNRKNKQIKRKMISERCNYIFIFSLLLISLLTAAFKYIQTANYQADINVDSAEIAAILDAQQAVIVHSSQTTDIVQDISNDKRLKPSEKVQMTLILNETKSNDFDDISSFNRTGIHTKETITAQHNKTGNRAF